MGSERGPIITLNNDIIMEVTLKFARQNPWAGIAKYKNCYDYIGSYLTRSGNYYTGLKPEEARELEAKLEYPEGTLAPSSSFWKTFSVKLGQRDTILHTENAFDELSYMFLRKHKRVANGFANIQPSHDYVLLNREAEAEELNRINKVKREAFAEFNKMSIEEMRKCLRIFGMKSDNISNELVESTLFTEIEKDPSRYFLLWVNNKNKQTQFIIEEAISKNIIRKNKNVYYYGTDVIGRTLEDAISTLDDKKNQDIKMAILDGINAK